MVRKCDQIDGYGEFFVGMLKCVAGVNGVVIFTIHFFFSDGYRKGNLVDVVFFLENRDFIFFLDFLNFTLEQVFGYSARNARLSCFTSFGGKMIIFLSFVKESLALRGVYNNVILSLLTWF
jgi:hypothetical protein